MIDGGFGGKTGFRGRKVGGKPIARREYQGGWDTNRPTPHAFELMLNSADNAIKDAAVIILRICYLFLVTGWFGIKRTQCPHSVIVSLHGLT